MHPSPEPRQSAVKFEPLRLAAPILVLGAIPSSVLWLLGGPLWSLPLPLAVALLALLALRDRPGRQPRAEGFRRGEENELLVREPGKGRGAPEWSQVPDEIVFGFVLEKRADGEAFTVFYEGSDDRAVARRSTAADRDGDEAELLKWLSDRYRRLEPENLEEAVNLKRMEERALIRGLADDLKLLPEPLKGNLGRTCEFLAELPRDSRTLDVVGRLNRLLPQLEILEAILREWVALENPVDKPPQEGEETIVLETFLATARAVTMIRDSEEDPDKRYEKWESYFRPLCGTFLSELGPGTDLSATGAGTHEPAHGIDPNALSESPAPANPAESWPKALRELVAGIPITPWFVAREIPASARDLILEHLRRLKPFRETGATYGEAFGVAKEASLALAEWAGWDPAGDAAWQMQFDGLRKQMTRTFGETQAGKLLARLRGLCELHCLWESAEPRPDGPNPWAPLIETYRLGLSVSFEDIAPFGTALEVPATDPRSRRIVVEVTLAENE